MTSAELAAFVEFAPPSIGADEIEEVLATLRSGWLSTGPRVARFEAAFARYTGAEHAVAVNSCTAALHLSLVAAGVGAGDEVITTPLTFCATANVVVHVGATPVFADIDPITMNLTPESAARAITSRTRAVMPVHFAGRPVDTAGFRELARRAGLVYIEDAAHCVEGISQGTKIGVAADLTCFSFYANKNLTTAEGGMVTTSSSEWADLIRVASLHGMSRGSWARYARDGSPTYEVLMPGFKYNMSDLQAALGIHQLAGIEKRLTRREAICRRYDSELADLPVTRPARVADGDRHARHLYTILVDEEKSGCSRDELRHWLRRHGVASSVHFKPLHLQPYYAKRFGHLPGAFPIAESISSQTLSLPLSPSMGDESVDRVIEVIRGRLGCR